MLLSPNARPSSSPVLIFDVLHLVLAIYFTAQVACFEPVSSCNQHSKGSTSKNCPERGVSFVMEALAALGLASNIISFVDFTWKLLAGANEIYASGSGIAGDVQFLDTVTKDVQHHAERVVAAQTSTPQLRNLARQCDEVAQELLSSIEKMRAKGGNTRWISFLAALKGVHSQKKIDQLTDKISKIQARMSALTQELLLYVALQFQSKT